MDDVNTMKLDWAKPQIDEQQVGLEASSYLPAELERPVVTEPAKE